jgi:hypothetical protein
LEEIMSDAIWASVDTLREKLVNGGKRRSATIILHPACSAHTADWQQKPYNDEAAAELNAKMFQIAEHGSVCYGRA